MQERTHLCDGLTDAGERPGVDHVVQPLGELRRARPKTEGEAPMRELG